jgi:hypothetical protein
MKTIRSSFYLVCVIILSGCTLSSNTLNQNDPVESLESINIASIIEEVVESPITPPLFITTMTHMEGNWHDDEIEVQFNKNVQLLRYGMDLYSEYDAKMTVESEKPFAQGSINWGVNILQEVLDKGHGVGTHCDIGFARPTPTFDEYVAQLSENKNLVDSLVGAENNRGCSGAGGDNDWVLGATAAGFEYVNGIVGMHYLAVPIENRPSPEWTDPYIRSTLFHDNVPLELEDRIHLIRLANTIDLEEDTNGTIVMLAGDIGKLDQIYDESIGMTREDCANVCKLTTEDVDALIELLLEAIALKDENKIAKATVYMPANMFIPENETVLRYFLSELNSLVDQSLLQWATQGEVYDAYLVWESMQ